MKTILAKIEELFGVKIIPEGPHFYRYEGKVTVDKCKEVIAANPGLIEWQNPDHPDCEIGDGGLYLDIFPTAMGDDTFNLLCFCFVEQEDNDFGICMP